MILIGYRNRTERVPNGRTRRVHCDDCRMDRPHHEHRRVASATAFFVPVFNVQHQTIWACTVCGARMVFGDEAPAWVAQDGSAVGAVLDAAGKVVETVREVDTGELGDSTRERLDQGAALAREGLAQGRELAEDGLEAAGRTWLSLVDRVRRR